MSDKRKKVIVLYSTGGMGHKKAAIALFEEFKKHEDIDVEMVDVLDYATPFYRFLYLDMYVYLMTKGKLTWGALYYFSNTGFVDIITRKLRGILDFNSLSGLDDMLKEKKPDAIVTTHFLLPSIAEILKKKVGLRSRMFTLITDYGPHSYWLSDYVDRFFVGADSVLVELEKRNIPHDKIDVTGIPTTEEFCRDLDIGSLRKTYGIDDTKRTIFLMSGGFGVGPIKKMLLSLNRCQSDIQVITVCGHNKKAYEDITLLKEELGYPVILFGFSDKIAELMAISDLMVTKAGGISVTEAMNSRLPMILFASMLGQETWNEHLLMDNGAAEKAKKIEDIPVLIDKILLSDQLYNTLKSGIDRVRRPDAAKDIVSIVTKEAGKDEAG